MKRVVLMAVLAIVLAGCAKPPLYHEPNIVIIGLDAVRQDHLSLFGYEKETTPYLTNFSRGGFVFTDAVTQAPWTLPSFMTLFTSLYPHQHTLTNRYIVSQETQDLTEVNLSGGIITLPEYLKSLGYSTAGFTGDAGLLGRYGFARGFDTYVDNKSFGGFADSVPEAIKWLREKPRQPFFLFLHGYEAHGKYQLPQGFFNSNFNVSEQRWGYYRNLTIWKKGFEISKAEQQAWYDWYDKKLRLMDTHLQPFFNNMTQLGLLNNTIFVIISDHGEGFAEHNMFDHGPNVYDEVARVVLIIKLPGTKGRVIAKQAGLIDVVPTLLELTGNSKSLLGKQSHGQSLVPLMYGSKPGHDVFTETDYLYNFYFRALRTKDGWKLIYNPEEETWQLYNLNRDPQETQNLVEDYPKQFAEMKQRIIRFMNS